MLAALALLTSSLKAEELTSEGKKQPDSIYSGRKFKERQQWAKSSIWTEAPKLEVEKWLSAVPETKGKYLLIEFWATYCPPCRRSLPFLNMLHKKYRDELCVIGISTEDEATVRACK